jgi:hypothetical protein
MDKQSRNQSLRQISFLGLSLLIASAALAQKSYFSSESELIFSFAKYSDSGDYKNTPPRFTAFLHFSERYHYDFGKNMGMFTGISLRNTGFTVEVNDTLKRKHRVYTLGVPLAIKLGNMGAKKFIYIGAEIELPFNYKEKTFIHGKKKLDLRFNEWFSSRTQSILPSVFFGMQGRHGLNLLARYYTGYFFNQSFQESGVKPYRNIKAQMFSFSVLFSVPDMDEYKGRRNNTIPTYTRY